MKILLVIDTYKGGNGGCITTHRLTEGLRKRGHRVTIISTDQGKGIFKVKGTYLPFVRESMEKMQFLFGIPEKKVLREAFADVDVVQIQFPFYLGYGAAKLARTMKKGFVGAFHVQPQNIIAAMGKESVIMEKVLFLLFKFFLFNRASVIQCPSQFAADLLQKNGIRRTLKVISNGIPEEYSPKEYDRPSFYGGNMVLINVGRHALEKRQTLLIEGVRRSKYANNIKLLLCGHGELSQTLIVKGNQLPNPPLVQYVSEEEKLLYLNTADLYIHGSIVELESLACLEAVGCGLPCLIGDSPHSAAPQFALDSRFIFKHDDADDLARKIDYWYEHRDELKPLHDKVLSMAEQFRFEKCLDMLEAMYREVRDNTFDTGMVVDVRRETDEASA